MATFGSADDFDPLDEPLPPGQAAHLVTSELSASNFSTEAHRLIFETVKDLHQRGLPHDLVAVAVELDQRGHLEAVGGIEYLLRCAGAAESVSATDLRRFVAEIREAPASAPRDPRSTPDINQTSREENPVTTTPELDMITTVGDPTISPIPDVRIVNVTPDMAADWLANRNTRNRNLGDRRVAGYIAEMNRGDWRFNGDAIRFDTDGNLLDGQHRLAAIVGSGATQPFVLAVGLPASAQDTMDQGAKRTIGNVLQMHGMADSSNIAAAAQLCWGYVHGTLGNAQSQQRRGTSQQIVTFVDGRAETLDAALKQGRALRKMLPIRISTAAAAYWIIAQAEPEYAALFWGPLLDGAGLTSGSPILVLRNRLTREAGAPRKAETRQILAAYIKAWNAWLEDRPISLLMWRDNEPFPKANRPA
ncbi:hypothetical protein MXD62_20115 [Frankia sp. Mgl5]|uniref:DnaB-like helicase N-terminal domain-containing protein n=1 Tax=Frankia sp. Mgl5 TaxID=2933793 RepID=UPI00200BAA37|nr:DnaB-like helicase N-terminal domain-containing protein [Frankia sp. Mgl5]MCK9929457.1 hypothetical protein [Frankia sp. Mgl5]